MASPSDRAVFVAGHRGMVGSAIVRCLRESGYRNIIVADRSRVDLRVQADVMRFFADNHVDAVVAAAAKVGGIQANNTYPADFIYQNLMIEANLVHAAHAHGVQDLLFLGSSCIYPREAPQPMVEECLLGGPLEPTNEPYAIAKIAGIKLCESYNRQYGRDYRCLMPTNLYGPGDNFHPENSHVIPALIRRFHEATQADAPSVTVWGSGRPLREFLHVEDLARACVHVLGLDRRTWEMVTTPTRSHVNVGTGVDCTIRDLAGLVADVAGYRGAVVFDDSKPDGTPRKLLDISRITRLGWSPAISLHDGLAQTYSWFRSERSVRQ